MEIFIAIGSIFALTLVMLFVNRVLRTAVCPICAGVSLTWLWMLAGMSFDLLPTSYFLLPVATMMGGSVVGIAYQVEKKLPAGSSPLFWKTLFIPAGFAGVYGVLAGSWLLAAGAFAAAAVIVIVFSREKGNLSMSLGEHAGTAERVAELEEKMKQCC